MKETKDWQMKCRLTATEKEKVLAYCEKYNMTISEFVRFACDKVFQEDKRQ